LYADPDPDPAAQINADPSGSGYGSGSETLQIRNEYLVPVGILNDDMLTLVVWQTGLVFKRKGKTFYSLSPFQSWGCVLCTGTSTVNSYS
jgi:hypothetical protein